MAAACVILSTDGGCVVEPDSRSILGCSRQFGSVARSVSRTGGHADAPRPAAGRSDRVSGDAGRQALDGRGDGSSGRRGLGAEFRNRFADRSRQALQRSQSGALRPEACHRQGLPFAPLGRPRSDDATALLGVIARFPAGSAMMWHRLGGRARGRAISAVHLLWPRGLVASTH